MCRDATTAPQRAAFVPDAVPAQSQAFQSVVVLEGRAESSRPRRADLVAAQVDFHDPESAHEAAGDELDASVTKVQALPASEQQARRQAVVHEK